MIPPGPRPRLGAEPVPDLEDTSEDEIEESGPVPLTGENVDIELAPAAAPPTIDAGVPSDAGVTPDA